MKKYNFLANFFKHVESHIKTELFKTKGINTLWFDDGGYLEYSHLLGGFEHKFFILDLLFNCEEILEIF